MTKGTRTAQADKVKLARKICEAYATNDWTIESCCKANGVSYSTFHVWVNERDGDQIGEIGAIYQQAQTEKDSAYKSNLKQLARTALEKRVSGYDLEVEETTDEALAVDGEAGNFSRIRVKKTVRHIPADVRAIIFALTNTDGQNFTDRPETAIDFSKLSEQEQEAILQKLADKLKKDVE